MLRRREVRRGTTIRSVRVNQPADTRAIARLTPRPVNRRSVESDKTNCGTGFLRRTDREGFSMSATLLVKIPLALLGVVALLGFVGCVFSTTGEQPSFTTYSDTTVLGNGNCVAYWPLWDAQGALVAQERVA